jgi:uncharacterized MnhB-related membrane protein
MYCPKCRTEYRKGFSVCADCEVPLVEVLPPVAESEKTNEVDSPALKLIKKALASLRDNSLATWSFVVVFGIFYYYAYLFTKNFWRSNIRFMEYLASFFDLNSNIMNVLFTIALGLIIDLTSAAVASLVCACIFLLILRKRQLMWFARHWRFWKAPDVGMKISAFLGPFVPVVIFVLFTWVLLNFSKRFNKNIV